MFSRIQVRPVAFTGAIHSFGDQSSPQNKVGVTDLSPKDDFRRNFNNAAQKSTQLSNIEQAPGLGHKNNLPAPQSTAMSYTGGWVNQMNPVMGGAPISHSDPRFEMPNYRNNHKPYFKGAEHQAVPAFMATAADFPVVKNQARVNVPKVSIQRPKTGAKLKAFKNHHPSKSPFSIELPYKAYKSS